MNIINLKNLAVIAAFGFVAACDGGDSSIDQHQLAQELVKNNIIIDTHIDVPYRLFAKMDDVSLATETGDFDYPRAKAGGLDGAFMSIYIPASMELEGTATAHGDILIDLVEGIVDGAPEKFSLANSVAEVRENHQKGLVSLPLGMENGAPIAGSMDNLKHFYDRGIRYITLTHSKSNHISDSSYDPDKVWGGLSSFGEEVVREMNNLGVMVDVSHVSDEAFWDVMSVTRTPVIASHSSARHFVPGFERNMSDDMIVALAENGGVIQINFGSAFVTAAANSYGLMRREGLAAYIEENELEQSEEVEAAFNASFEAEHGSYPYASLDETLDHFDHVVKIAGIDHVGIGSDYDGVGDSLPQGLKDVSTYANLAEGLLNRGYSQEDVIKVLGENLLRVWSEVEAAAAKE